MDTWITSRCASCGTLIARGYTCKHCSQREGEYLKQVSRIETGFGPVITKEVRDLLQIDLTNMDDYRIIPQLIEKSHRQIHTETEKYIYERLMDLQIDKDILLNQTQEIRRLNNVLRKIKGKQEQGLLIELNPIEIVELQDKARILFDSWNNTTGAIPSGTSWYYEALGAIEDIVKFAFGAGVLYKAKTEGTLEQTEETAYE